MVQPLNKLRSCTSLLFPLDKSQLVFDWYKDSDTGDSFLKRKKTEHTHFFYPLVCGVLQHINMETMQVSINLFNAQFEVVK